MWLRDHRGAKGVLTESLFGARSGYEMFVGARSVVMRSPLN